MPTLTHGSDLRLAPTIRGFVSGSAGPRQALTKLAEARFPAVQLDATLAGIRPRELDRSARRDLASAIRRLGLDLAGLDFFIPAEHYTDPAHADNAYEAARSACQLASDLGRVPLSINLPIAEQADEFADALLDLANSVGVPIAVVPPGDLASLSAWLDRRKGLLVGADFDPAGLLAQGADPLASMHALGARLLVGRLSDARRGSSSAGPVAVGHGDLDLVAYRVSLDLAGHRLGPVVLDLRSLSDPVAAAQSAKRAWAGAAPTL